MAEPVRNPNFPPVSPERELPVADLSTTEQLIVTEAQPSNPRLNQTAEAVGSAVGSAVRRVDKVRERFNVIRGKAEETAAARSEELKRAAEEWKQAAEEKAQDVKTRAAEAIEEIRAKASERFEDARWRASEKLQEAKWAAQDGMENARQRVKHLANERPLQVIAGAAVAGFAIGVALRTWRSSRG